jgi:flagellar biosynthesis/type III secretory pathway protein FliH
MALFTPLRARSGFMARLVHGADGDVPLEDEAARSGVVAGDPDTAAAIAQAEAEMGQLEEGISGDDGGESPADGSPLLPTTLEELEALIAEVEHEAREAAAAALTAQREAIAADRAILTRLIDEITRARRLWSREVREHLGELLVTGVRQVVGGSADLQANALRERLVEVGQRLVGERDVILRVRPEDVAVAEGVIGDRAGWKIVPDDTLAGGGCVAETEAGKVDATMGAAVSGITAAVTQWIDESDADGAEE